MAKPGKHLEELVTKLERVLADQNVRIESPAKLRDKVTKRLREHDVLLTLNPDHHHRSLTAIECRDRSRPVGVEAIEAFHTKCQHTGINQGVIVSATGFTTTAREKAAFHGIKCMDLTLAEKFDWLRSTEMDVMATGLGPHLDLRFVTAEKLATPPSEFEVLDAAGALVSLTAIRQNIHSQLERFGVLSEGTHPRGARLMTPGFSLRDTKSGVTHSLVRIEARIQVVVKKSKTAFQLVSYEEKAGAEKVVSQAALVPITNGPIQGDLVFSQKPGEGIEVKFIFKGVKNDTSPAPDRPQQTKFRTKS